jgi:hypothetical protein
LAAKPHQISLFTIKSLNGQWNCRKSIGIEVGKFHTLFDRLKKKEISIQKGPAQPFKSSFDISHKAEIAFRHILRPLNQILDRQLQASDHHVLIEISNNCLRYKKAALSKPPIARQGGFDFDPKWSSFIFQSHTSLGDECHLFALNLPPGHDDPFQCAIASQPLAPSAAQSFLHWSADQAE